MAPPWKTGRLIPLGKLSRQMEQLTVSLVWISEMEQWSYKRMEGVLWPTFILHINYRTKLDPQPNYCRGEQITNGCILPVLARASFGTFPRGDFYPLWPSSNLCALFTLSSGIKHVNIIPQQIHVYRRKRIHDTMAARMRLDDNYRFTDFCSWPTSRLFLASNHLTVNSKRLSAQAGLMRI